jgi:beta-glucosidase
VLHAAPQSDGVLPYAEGLLIGYRGYDASGAEPRYPFGHGLGYTTWAYESAEVTAATVAAGGDAEVTVRVRNTGPRAGREVVQAYVAGPPEPGRPVRALAAFGAAVAGPGETVAVRLRVPARAFARWDTAAGGWAWPAGRYEIQVGRSARDLRLTTAVESG